MVEGQERNISQLVRIRAVVNRRWSLKEDLQGSDEEEEEEDREWEESEEEPKESQEEVLEGILLSASC